MGCIEAMMSNAPRRCASSGWNQLDVLDPVAARAACDTVCRFFLAHGFVHVQHVVNGFVADGVNGR